MQSKGKFIQGVKEKTNDDPVHSKLMLFVAEMKIKLGSMCFWVILLCLKVSKKSKQHSDTTIQKAVTHY